MLRGSNNIILFVATHEIPALYGVYVQEKVIKNEY